MRKVFLRDTTAGLSNFSLVQIISIKCATETQTTGYHLQKPLFVSKNFHLDSEAEDQAKQKHGVPQK